MTAASPTRVLLADDHRLVRQGLRMLIDAEPDLEVVAEAGDGVEAVAAVRERDLDLAILDVSMPRMTGINAAREILAVRPGVRVLMLSMHDSAEYLFEALRAGASGYVLKSGADRDLIEAARAAMRDEPFLYPSAIRTLIREHLERDREDWQDVLTPRETEIVKLIAEAHSSKEIGELLHISAKTVERHRENILRKLGMSDRVELTRYAIRRGFVEP
jgi:DNA-binding NarL/FixJ family response regulator